MCFPISIMMSPVNEHDSTKSIDVMESISNFVDDDCTINQIVSVYADKGLELDTKRDVIIILGLCIWYQL